MSGNRGRARLEQDAGPAPRHPSPRVSPQLSPTSNKFQLSKNISKDFTLRFRVESGEVPKMKGREATWRAGLQRIFNRGSRLLSKQLVKQVTGSLTLQKGQFDMVSMKGMANRDKVGNVWDKKVWSRVG